MAKMSFLFHPLFLAVVLNFFMAKFAMSAPEITIDVAALLQLKAHVTMDPHNFFAHNWNWLATTNSSASVCNWVGVTCSARHQRVTALSLPNLGLDGTIPPHIGNLSFLVSFNISGNSFNGTLPNELLHLRRLKVIDLSSNILSGSLPDGLCNSSTQLEWFEVSSNRLTGQLPSSLGDCNKLKRFSISGNKITGTIPPSIGNLAELVELYLDSNSFEGEFPPSIFNISSLKSIVVIGNSFSGSLPVDMCHPYSSLEEIVLQNNKFTGRIPSSIGNCTLLSILRLGLNQLTGEIPYAVGNLHNLKILDFGYNYLTGFIPSMIFNNSNIRKICLTRNHLSGHLPTSIGLFYLPNLRGLFLEKNNLSGIIPGSICNASKVVDLYLTRNLFYGLVPNVFGSCRQLQNLYLTFNHLTAAGSSTQGQSFFSSLTNCRSLRSLAIDNNPLKGFLPASVGNLSTSLAYFYAASAELSGEIPSEFGNLSSMITLSLFDNELAGTIPGTVGKLHKLQGLELYQNNLQGSIPNELCTLESINMILLYNNAIQGQIPTCFANLTSLRYLNLSSNRLNSSIPSTFWSLKYILRVDLSFNSLSGSLPLDIQNLEVLTDLYLSGNQLSGSIPRSIGGLKDLISLALESNEFQGPIPNTIGNLISLESLDLSDNNLSGVIPKSLELLTYLGYFNVSFNELEGEIPSGGPFVNFTAESFMQNRGLCGSYRLQVPSCKTSSSQRSKATILVLRYVLPAIATTTVALAFIIIILILIRRRKKNKCLPIVNDLLKNPVEMRRISYEEIRQATNGFNETNLLGKGLFSSVYEAKLADGTSFAIKVFNLQQDGTIKSFDSECEIMSRIRHRNLLKIITSCSNLDFKALILQYMPQGSLEKWLYSHESLLDTHQRLDIMIDVAHALEYLHHGYPTPIIHCDLKPSNVLLDDDLVARLCDFGIAKLLNGQDSVTQTMTLATIGYMAPEYGSEGIVSTSGDVYSFGILMMETFTRKRPTDERFTGEMSLKRWVEEASSPLAVSDVVDASLLSRGEEEEADFAAKMNCLSSVMSLALRCSAEIPVERMSIKDALVDLQKIKTNFLMEVQSP